MTTAEALPGQPNERTVADLYEKIFGRTPSGSEVIHWSGYLENNSVAKMQELFINSQEYREWHAVRPGHPVGHFYSPVVDPAQIDVDRLRRPMEDRELDLLGISIERMTEFWNAHADMVGAADFQRFRSAGARFYLANHNFSYADALMLRAMMLIYRPRRVIEIGSGFSSAVMLDAIDEAGLATRLTCIEPYPDRLRELLHAGDDARMELIAEPVQDVDPARFEDLRQGDIVFIDSTHVLKTQSDVCVEFFSIVPRLASGVLVHFHDIFYPFEYPKAWVVDRRHSWNEIYALRLFLMYNRDFEVLFFNSYFGEMRRALVERTCPSFLTNTGGSFWIRKR